MIPDGERLTCRYCGRKYDVETAEKHTQTLKSVLDEAKMEMVHNLRGNLYRAVSAQYISSYEVKEVCGKLKMFLPDDFRANFFEIAAGTNIRKLTRAIREIDVEENYEDMESVVNFLIKSIDSDREYLLELNNLVDRAFKTRNLALYHHYATEVAEQADRVRQGVYETKLPRDAFIAYSSQDMEHVSELVEELEEQNIECFVAARNLRHGKGSVENYDSALKEAMDNCASIVFVSSRNSRNFSCDALRVELAYIKAKDIENAPPELRNHYTMIPHEYKKPRVEYRLDESRKSNAADRITDEFFDGYERVYTPSDVAYRILRQEGEVPTILHPPVATNAPPQTGATENAEQARLEAKQREEQAKLLAKQKAEQEKLEAKRKAEEERQTAERVKQAAKQKAEEERLAAERAKEEARQAAKQKAEEERLAAARAKEEARLAAERAKEEAKQKAEAEKQAKREERQQAAEAAQDAEADGSASKKRVIPLVVIVIALLCAAAVGGGVMLAGKKPSTGTKPIDTTAPLPPTGSETTAITEMVPESETVPETLLGSETTPETVMDSETVLDPETIPETETTPEFMYSEGLKFVDNGNSTYFVSSIGTCTDTVLSIPPTYKNKPVIRIGPDAFVNNDRIQEVVLSENIKIISDWAFGLCMSLSQVTIPEGVTTIGALAFQHCPLTSIAIPDSVTSIGEGAFAGCAPILTEIQVGAGNTAYRVENGCLVGTATKTVIAVLQTPDCKIPDGIKRIGGLAAVGLQDMTSITLPSSLESIGSLAFDNCSGLTDIHFQGTKAQWHLITKEAGWDRDTPDSTIHCTDGDIKKSAFLLTQSFDELRKNGDEKDGVFTPGQSEAWNGVATVDQTVYNLVYWGWVGLSTDAIGTFGYRIDSNTPVYDSSFAAPADEAVQEAAFAAGTPLATRMHITINIENLTGTHTVTALHKTVDGKETVLGEFQVVIENTATYSTGLSYSLQSNGEYQVAGLGSCTDTVLKIPPTYNGKPVTSMAQGAFKDNQKITKVILPKSMKSVSAQAFVSCSKLRCVVLPNSITSIEQDALARCGALTTVLLPNSLTSVGSWAFYDDGALESIAIPKNLSSFGQEAFAYCGYESLAFADGATFVERYVFISCSDMTSLYIPKSMREFDYQAFREATSLTDIYFQGTKAEWEAIQKNEGWDSNSGFYTVHCIDGTFTKA